MTGWQPIETAPQDGAPILVAMPDGSLTTAFRDGPLWCDTSREEVLPDNPTHWMPLIAGPTPKDNT